MSQSESLNRFSETRFDHKVPDGLPRSNPIVDLTVSWDASGKNLLIVRPRDQIVSKIHQYSRPGTVAPEPLAIAWKPDGQFLAVGWSDGIVRLMGLENNKTAHHMRISEDDSVKITHIGWSCNSVNRNDAQQPSTSWQDLMAKELDFPGQPAELDLPRELTFLEIEESLPKISPLPPGSAGEGDDAMVFTLRSGIDFLFKPLKTEESDQVHVMIVGTTDGRLHLSVYDSFVIGDFRYTLPSSMYRPGVLQLVHHASHRAISTHTLVLKHPADYGKAIYLVPMDLPFISSSPINLTLLASKLTTLQTLLRYVKQTQLHMTAEYNNSRELPSRFLRAIQEDLEKNETAPTDIVQALFHTVVTGHAYDMVKEWLVDNLAERGHKRWDKAVTSGLENLRSLVHENFIPALQRCSIILSRLRGLAQFYDTRDDIGFSVAQISRAMDVVACLTMIAHRVLLQVMEELELFSAFSSWLRFQIDRLASSNADSEELMEKEAMMDNGKVLEYIQRFLTLSPMGVYFDEITNDERDEGWQACEGTGGSFGMLDTHLKSHDAGQRYIKALPQVRFLIDLLDKRASGIFKDIAEAQKRSVRFGQPTRIVMDGAITRMDSTMHHITGEAGDRIASYTAVCQEGTKNTVYIFRTEMHVVRGISTAKPSTITSVHVAEEQIVDLKFLDSTTLVLLLSNPDNKPSIVKIHLDSPRLNYIPFVQGSLPDPQDASSITTPDGQQPIHLQFPEDRAFAPVQMEVHRATDARGEMPPRICLLGRDRTVCRVFSIGPSTPEASQDAEGGQDKAQGKGTPFQTPIRAGGSM